MGFAFVLLITCAFVLWIYFLWPRRHFYKVAWQLPGPVGLPFIGMGLQMMNPEKFLQFMDKVAAKYKCPFISWMGTKCFLYVNDPITAEAVFNSPHCTNKGDFYRFMASAIGDGLFTSSSPRWNKHRRLINPAFSRQVISNFLPIFNAEADNLLNKFITEGTTKKLEIYEMLKKSVLEAACQTTMGKKMNFQNDGSAAIFTSYNGVTEVCVKRMLSPWLYPDVVYRRSSLFERQQKVVGVLCSFVENLLQQSVTSKSTGDSDILTLKTKNSAAVSDTPANYNHDNNAYYNAKANSTSSNNENNKNSIDKVDDDDSNVNVRKSKAIFVEQVRNYVEQGQLTWDDVRDEANVTIAATFETTSTALYLVCLCLAMHPEYQDKLHRELVELFPDNENNTHSDSSASLLDQQQVTSAHLERMTYAEMVINEAMRLFAPVPMVLRSVSSDFRLPNGVTVPCGTQIGIDIYNMQRSIEWWGAEARHFRPDLHFGPDAEPRHPFAFTPFTRGLRMCIGYRYAMMLMKVLLAKIFRNFRIRTDAKMQDLIIKGTISLKLRDYPLCVVERR